MVLISFFSLVSVIMFYANANNPHAPRGVSLICHERYFLIITDQFFTGKNICFEAVDENGVYPITEEYAAKCGYSIIVHLKNNVQLRASYFSCHTDKEDEEFRFSFNLKAHDMGKEVTYPLHGTCSPSLPWSLREVTCEVNYMEVSITSDITCPPSTKRNDWENLKLAHSPAAADWQVTFQTDREQMVPMSLKEARIQGYVFDLIGGRLVFRTPYGQPHSFPSMMDGVPVEVVHATLFSRQKWLVLLVDLVAACSIYEATYEDEGYMSWETPDVLYPGLRTTNYSFGLGGKLMQPADAKEEGFLMEKSNNTVEIGIPCDAEGSYRKTVIFGDLFEIFTYDFYVEQISVDEDDLQTRIRTLRTIRTPLLKRTLLDENRTVLEEHRFTVYLGDIPQDMQLISVTLNFHQFQVPFGNDSTFSLTKVAHSNDTHGYILMVPFHNSPVTQQFYKEDLQFKLDINYTLMVTHDNHLYNHSASYEAIVPDLSPPQFEAFCSESGISFRLEHKPSNCKWEITVGSEPLTLELASKQGFIMSNNSQTLQLDVPLLSSGYEKKNFSLQGFMGTLEINVQDRETSEVRISTAKTCPYLTNEFIVCSADMRMIAIVNMSLSAPSGGVPANMTLLDRNCGPVEADATKALFSLPVNSCGSKVKFGWETVTYENEILYSKPEASANANRVYLQCTYRIHSLLQLFKEKIFEAEAPGAGLIIHTSTFAKGLRSTTMSPASQSASKSALLQQQSLYSSSRYIKVLGLQMPQQLHGKRIDGTNVHTARRLF